MGRYLLLLSAKGSARDTRIYHEYSSKEEAVSSIIQFYEDYLDSSRPMDMGIEEQIEYDSSDVDEFIDFNFGEMVCLEYDEDVKLWTPYPKSWIKETIYCVLRLTCDAQRDRSISDGQSEQPSQPTIS